MKKYKCFDRLKYRHVYCTGLYYVACLSRFAFFFYFNPFPKRQILVSSKLKEFADDNFEFDEIGIKFFKRVENIVRKGEIARYE